MANFLPVKALTVFEAVVRGQGLDPATAGLGATEKARVAALVSRGLARAWQRAFWPQLMDVRRIAYRPAWSAATEYVADDEAYTLDAEGMPVYWRALRANTNVAPVTGDTVWEQPEDFLPGFVFCTHLIDEVNLEDACYLRHPERSADPRPFRLRRTAWGAAVADPSGDWPTWPWVKFRPVPPEYSWTADAGGTAYVAGDLCFSGQDTWQCIAAATGVTPGTDGTKWRAVAFPKMFQDYVEEYAVAMRMQDDDGRAAALGKAEAELDRTYGVLSLGIGERRKVSVRVV